MKSKYAPLVKLKKKELDRAERELIRANNALASATDALERSYHTLSQLSLVQSGTASELFSSHAMIQAQHGIIDECQKTLQDAYNNQNVMRENYKTATIEFEKFKYLEVEEAKAIMVKNKKEEAKMLDEIGTMTYTKEDK